jgi:uncharacterized protein (AIM24 family)
MRSALFSEQHLEAPPAGTFTLQNPKLLKVALDGHVFARQGAMVAYQGEMDFEFSGAGVGRFLKRAISGEDLPLMRCKGRGDLFLAHDADEVHLIRLEGDALSVNGANVLAFESTVDWDVNRVKGAGVLSGGLFNVMLTGTGTVAVTAHGTPVVLTVDAPTYADVQSAVAWSASLRVDVARSYRAAGLIGRGSGEAVQLSFTGQGFVVVQASEGPTVPPHSHGQSG